jgi:hypothetical protein
MAVIVVGLIALAVLYSKHGFKSNHVQPATPAASTVEAAENKTNLASQSAPVAKAKPDLASSNTKIAVDPTKDNSEPDAKQMEEWRKKLNQSRELEKELQKKPAGELLSRFLSLWRNPSNDQETLEEKFVVKLALTHSLQTGGESSNADVYHQLSALLRDATLGLDVKREIAGILGSVQTVPSVQFILGEYQQANDETIREILGTQIARTGDNRSSLQFPEQLSPLLESAWALAKDDPKLAQALADGLAKVGSPSGVQLLVAALVDSGWNGENLADLKDPQARAALQALVEVRNPNALSVLTTGLLNNDSPPLQKYVSGLSLAAMGKVEATDVLMRWAATASDQEVNLAQQWFGKIRDTASFELVANTLNRPNEFIFSSAAIRAAVARSLENR